MVSNVSNGTEDSLSVSPCIVEFYDAFSNLEDGGVALMMEYMDGGSLQDIVDLGVVMMKTHLQTLQDKLCRVYILCIAATKYTGMSNLEIY